MAFDFGAFAGGIGQGITQGQEQRARYRALADQQALKQAEAAYAQGLEAAKQQQAAPPPPPPPQAGPPVQRPMPTPMPGAQAGPPPQQMALPGARPMLQLPAPAGGSPMAQQPPPTAAAPAPPPPTPQGPGAGGAGGAPGQGGLFDPQQIQQAGQMWKAMQQQSEDLLRSTIKLIVTREQANGKKPDYAAALEEAEAILGKEDINPLMKELINANLVQMRIQGQLMGIHERVAGQEDVAGINAASREQVAQTNVQGRETTEGMRDQTQLGVAGINANSREQVAGTNAGARLGAAQIGATSREDVAGTNAASRDYQTEAGERNVDVKAQAQTDAASANATGKPAPVRKPLDRVQKPVRGDSGSSIPPEAIKYLKEGEPTYFANGQAWMKKNGQPVRVK